MDAALKGIELALSDARAPLERTDHRLEFSTGSLLARSGWDLLAPISDGVVEVAADHDGVTVSYRVTVTRLVWGASLASLAVFGSVLLLAPNPSVVEALTLLLLTWTVGVGGTHVITRLRLPEFLADAAKQLGPPRKKRVPWWRY